MNELKNLPFLKKKDSEWWKSYKWGFISVVGETISSASILVDNDRKGSFSLESLKKADTGAKGVIDLPGAGIRLVEIGRAHV